VVVRDRSDRASLLGCEAKCYYYGQAKKEEEELEYIICVILV